MTMDRLEQDPTPEQIRERCLEIQATWSPLERLKRLGGAVRYQMPKGSIRSNGKVRKIASALSYECAVRTRMVSMREISQIIVDNNNRVSDENYTRTRD